MPDLLALAEGVSVPVPDDGSKLRYSQEAVDAVTDFLGLLVFGSNEWAGKPFQLLPWEEGGIRQFYGVQVEDDRGAWVRYRRFFYVELPKKNGKSELAAGLGLYHLLFDGEERPQIGIFAADKNNADIVYQAAKYMVEHSCLGQPEHDPIAWARDSRREIHTKYGGILKVYSSDAESKHGYSFSCIIFDELHAQPNRRLWDVLTVGSDAARRQQAVIVLTTAGDDPNRRSIGWEVHEKCRRLLAWREGRPERELDEDDPQWLPVMYGVSALTGDDPDALAALDIYDEALWARCNPSYGVILSPRQFRAEARAARQSEAAERGFRWLRLNQWISTHAVGWIPVTLYDKTQIGPSPMAEREAWVAEHLRGRMCYAGLDLSSTTDLTALTLLFPPQGDLTCWVALFHAWRPRADVAAAEQRDHVPYRDWERAGFLTLCEGDIIDYDQVEDYIRAAMALYRIDALGVDPYLSRTLTQRLMAAGLTVIEIPQTMLGMTPAMRELERGIRGGTMRHVHNTAGRWCFGNMRCAVDGNENMKPMKNRSIGRIDITVSWIIAMAAALIRRTQGRDLREVIDQGNFHL